MKAWIGPGISALWLSSGAGLTAQPLTLAQAVEEAWRNSPALAADGEEVRLAEAKRQSALAKLLPVLSTELQWSRSDDQVAVFGTKLRRAEFTAADFSLPALNHPDPINNWRWGIDAYLPLLASGRNWNNRQTAAFEQQAAEQQVSYHRRALRYSVAVAYLAIATFAEREKTVAAGVTQLQQLEDGYKLLRAPNSATTTSFLVSKSICLSWQARRRQLQSAKFTAWQQLQRLMGRGEDGPLPEVEAVTLPAAVAETPPGDRRDDLAALVSAREGLGHRLNAQRGRFGPQLGFFANYAVNSADLYDGSAAYTFGLTLAWPLFDYHRYADLNELRARQRQLQQQLREKELQIQQEQRESAERLAGLLQQHENAAGAAASAEEALRFAGQRYRQGSLPLKDMSEAIDNWVAAALAHSEVRFLAAGARAEGDFRRGQ